MIQFQVAVKKVEVPKLFERYFYDRQQRYTASHAFQPKGVRQNIKGLGQILKQLLT
jgi:hypothetical protein